jgi:glycerol-1-phosphate dehydrogenase [NAD(P)+]
MENFRFIDGQLIHREFMCECGRKHVVPIQEIVVRQGALHDIGKVLNRLDLGKKCVVIADLNTHDTAGEKVIEILHNTSYTPKLCLFNTREMVKPDEYAIGKVMLDIDLETSFLLVVGSGSLTDLVRYISSRTRIPFISVPTAASMDGYASSGAPMLHGGYKRTILSTYPQAIIADIDVFSQAPYEMTAAGFSDMIGKLNSRVDWQFSHIITGEYYCEFFVELIDEVVQMCVANTTGIKQRDPEIMGHLMEGLILSGIGMVLIGNSRPASGSEHSLSHYWEMKAILENHPQYLHGTKVGVGTGVMAKFYEKFFSRDPAKIDLATVKQRKQSLEHLEAYLHECLGPVAESVIKEVTRPSYLNWEEQQRQIERLQTSWEAVKALQAIEPTFARVVEIQRAAEASIMPGEIDVDRALLREALLNAKEIRSRFTVLRAAEILGWLEEITEEVVGEYECEG